MSSVDKYEDCPQCKTKGAFYVSFQTRTLEYDEMCFHCGYRRWERTLIDRKKEKETGERHFFLTKDGKRIMKQYEREGHGCYSVHGGGRCGVIGCVHPKHSKRMVKELTELSKKEGYKIWLTTAKGENVTVVINTGEKPYPEGE